MHVIKAFLIVIIGFSLSIGVWALEPLVAPQAPLTISFDRPVPQDDGSELIRFPSPVQTEAIRNNTVPLRLYFPKTVSGPYPMVLVLHYWGASDQKNEIDLAQRLNAQGIACGLLELPYHLSRAPEGTRSGQLAVTPDPAGMIKTMEQAVADVRRSIDWMETDIRIDAKKIGLAGTSLGGIVGGLAFTQEPRITAYCSVLGGASIADTVWESSRLVRERKTMRDNGWNRSSLGEALKSIEPASYANPTETRPVYLIAARYDTVMPLSSYEKAIEIFPNCQSLWIETGHYGGYLVQTSIQNSVTKFFLKSFSGQKFKAPARLYAPTLRLSSIASTEGGIQVGVGLDLWKLDAKGSGFGSVLVTPRGVQAFVGADIGGGFAVGVNFRPKKTGIGLLWSFVL